MAPARRCYIHVGLPKTGTSYLQSIFWQSAGALAEQGLQMLPSSERDTFHMMLGLRGQLRAEMDAPDAFSALDRFRRQAADAACPNALVTQELLGAAKPDQIATLLEALHGYEVHVVVTVRDLASFAPSAWQQHVKARGGQGLDEYLARLAGVGSARPTPAYDVHGVLDRWGSRVPPERVHVVTVPRRGTSERVLLERYCSVLGVDPDALDTHTPSANKSLGLVQAELLRRVNLALGDRLPHLRAGYREQGRAFLAGQILQPQDGTPARVPQRLREWCFSSSEALIARLENSGYDIVGDLADLTPDPSAFAPDDQAVSDSEVALAAVSALASVLERRDQDRQKSQRLRARLRRQQQLIEELTAAPPKGRLGRATRRLTGR